MPARLHTFYRSLEEIIIEYCETKTSTYSVVSQTNNPEDIPDLETPNLNECILALEQSNSSGGIDRSSLLRYLLHAIEQLRPFIDTTYVLDETSTNNVKEELSQFIINIQKLLNMTQKTQLMVKYNNQEHSVNGCVREGILGLCTSGNIIQKKLFTALSLSVNTNEDIIKRTIDDIINAQQHKLMIAKIKCLQEENDELRRANTEKIAELLDVRSKLETINAIPFVTQEPPLPIYSTTRLAGSLMYPLFSFLRPPESQKNQVSKVDVNNSSDDESDCSEDIIDESYRKTYVDDRL